MPITLHGTYYTALEASEKLGYRDSSYFSALCKTGKIPAEKVGTIWLIPESVVLELDRQEVKGQGITGVARE